MGTRCQVHVVQENVGWEQAVFLYHHFDGYPENILPLIGAAELSIPANERWKAGRTGIAAAFLCYSDPGGFEPEEGHELHGDISYFYELYLINIASGSMAENPIWEVAIYEPPDAWNEERESLVLKVPRTPIGILLKSAGLKPYRRNPDGTEIPLK